MRSWAKKLHRATAVAPVLAILPIMSGPAQAADVACNQKNQRLTATPYGGNPGGSVLIGRSSATGR